MRARVCAQDASAGATKTVYCARRRVSPDSPMDLLHHTAALDILADAVAMDHALEPKESERETPWCHGGKEAGVDCGGPDHGR